MRVEGHGMWYLYILKCKDNSIYTGITDNIERRFDQHLNKTTHFTSYNPPSQVIYSEKFKTRGEARKREIQIKGWTRAKKLALANGDKVLLKKL